MTSLPRKVLLNDKRKQTTISLKRDVNDNCSANPHKGLTGAIPLLFYSVINNVSTLFCPYEFEVIYLTLHGEEGRGTYGYLYVEGLLYSH